MKKHNKDVLRATLFALIAIFIMIGAAGLLFAEHKKKLQKEQQKNAAIEALEKVPTVTHHPPTSRDPYCSEFRSALDPDPSLPESSPLHPRSRTCW